MRTLALVVVLHASLCAQAADPSSVDVCEAWARNAIIGARHALRGHGRALAPLSQAALEELVEHGGLRDMDDVAVLDEHYRIDAARLFLEDSIFYGFDYAKRTPEGELPQEYDAILEMFERTCMERDVPPLR